jgi:hypothetical protein
MLTARTTGRTARSGTRLVAALLLVLAAMTGGVIGGAGIAHADASPCANSYVCVVVGTPGSGGGSQGGGSGGGGSGGNGACYYQNQVEPCYIPGIGALDSSDGCYYIQMQPQPPAGDPLWQGHKPGDGAIYVRTCALSGGGGTVSLWMAAGPPAPVQVTPAQLAHMAVAKLPLLPAQPETAPGNGKPGLVNTPVMLWLDPVNGNGNYGDTYASAAKPLTVTASVPGLSVTATVWSPKVTWQMGDGGTVVCPDAGTAYTGTLVNGCTYTYSKASAAYAVNAQVSWTVSWAGGGASGTFPMDDVTSLPLTLPVDEIQVLN